MEKDCGLPKAYFDMAYSIYAVGWTTDLTAAFRNIASCLKSGGVFVFSWDHPLMHCVDVVNGQLVFSGTYTEDEPFSYLQRGQPVTVQNRRLSTYINELADAGFTVERLVEETDYDILSRSAEFSSGYLYFMEGKKDSAFIYYQSKEEIIISLFYEKIVRIKRTFC